MGVAKMVLLGVIGLFSLAVGGWMWVHQDTFIKSDVIEVAATPLPSWRYPLQAVCPTLAEQTTSAYLPVAGSDEARLTISGVVYAADMVTPLADVWLEVWQAGPTDTAEAYPAATFSGKYLSDASGHYRFTTMRPAEGGVVNIDYRIGYLGNTCPLMTMRLIVKDVPPPDKAPVPAYIHHPIDLYLPVPPPGGNAADPVRP